MPKSEEVPDLRRPVNSSARGETRFTRPQPHALEGQYVALRRIDLDADAAELFARGHEGDAPALWRYLAYGPFASPGQMAEWLAQCAASADPLWFVPRTKPAGSAIGMGALMRVRADVGVAEMGHIWIGPAYQRSREVTEALFLLMDHVLTDCRYRRLEWKCNALNARSRRAARRLGFRYEGTFYNHDIVKGQSVWFSIIDSEWAEIRRPLLAWLDPGNFDAAGRQRSLLGARP